MNTTSAFEIKALFNSFKQDTRNTVSPKDVEQTLSRIGILCDDIRLRKFFLSLQEKVLTQNRLNFSEFSELSMENPSLVSRALTRHLIVPDFQSFRQKISDIFYKVLDNQAGEVASYIPQLAQMPENAFGVSICTVDGQRLSIGDSDTFFSIQSSSKPINYCLALEENGADEVLKHIGREPSGHGFNAITLDALNRPHNPMINAGAIMSCSMIRPKEDQASRFDYIMNMWTQACGGTKPGFNNSIYLSERDTADRNFALGYFMKEKGAFPQGTDIYKTLEIYTQCCSIEASTSLMSIMAATLAKAGVCPMTNKHLFASATVKDRLSVMHSCGMYDFSGEFSFLVGLPAKSGVSGVVLLVIPNVMGICIWSPRLDVLGNSVRGVQFCTELIKHFNFHVYDSILAGYTEKLDPRLHINTSKSESIMEFCWAASTGDFEAIQKLLARGIPINQGDYDKRTPLHLAACEGHAEIVEFLLSKGANPTIKDRWGRTPADDAKEHGHKAIQKLLSVKRPRPKAAAQIEAAA
ncbi:MAG: glutaminase A [Deltaproteobacteria bacterium]|nr:glutaminase A [Deltaproteobacteria bacterium]